MPRTRARAPLPTWSEEADEARRQLTAWPQAHKRGTLSIGNLKKFSDTVASILRFGQFTGPSEPTSCKSNSRIGVTP
jgi:hypothetical protein